MIGESFENEYYDRWLACQAHFHEVFVDALASDLENGVKWMNEAAAEEFKRKYPALTKALEALRDY